MNALQKAKVFLKITELHYTVTLNGRSIYTSCMNALLQ